MELDYERKKCTPEQSKQVMEMTGRRWNQLIDAVNRGIPKSEIRPAMNEGEEITYDNMASELAEWRKKYPDTMFSLGEYEYDDPGLDLYHDEFWADYKLPDADK